MSKYKRAAVGGTFDILHIGHKHLLETSFQISEEVVIGVTSDNFVNKLNKKVLNNYDTRTDNIRDFIDSTFPILNMISINLKIILDLLVFLRTLT